MLIQIQPTPCAQAGKEGEHGDLWRAVAAAVGTGRSYGQCYERWRDSMRPGLQKGRTWNEAKDRRLVALVQRYGEKAWEAIAAHFPGVPPRKCRQRYINQLHPSRKAVDEPWTEEEEKQFRTLHAREGNRWATISRLMGHTRSEQDCKNKFWTAVQKRKRLEAAAENGAEKAAASADSTLLLPAPATSEGRSEAV